MENTKDFKCIICGNSNNKFLQDYKSNNPCFYCLKVVECCSCGHRTAFPYFPDSHFEKYYQNDYFNEDGFSKKEKLLVKQASCRADFIMHNANFSRRETLRILDIGAGHGLIGNELCSRFKNTKVEYDVVETNKIAINYLSMVKGRANNLFHELQDVNKTNYNLIIISHILEHFSDPLLFIKNISKHLAKDGFFFIEIPNEYSLWKKQQEPHLHFFSLDTIKRFIIKAGITAIKIDTCGEIIEDCIERKKLIENNTDELACSILRKKARSDFDYYGGNRRWIRSLCTRQKKILFLLLYPVYLRNFEPVIIELASRGYIIHIAFNDLTKYQIEDVKEVIDSKLFELANKFPNLTYDILTPAPCRRKFTNYLAIRIRAFCDYVRYLDPKYAFMKRLKTRCRKKNPSVFITFADIFYKVFKNTSFLFLIYQKIERALGIPNSITKFLRVMNYDALLLTPLVNVASGQVDYIKAARSLKIPSILTVHSWDNLTNKGLMRILPDKVIVWNNYQVEEACEIHGMSKDNVIITGAQCYDHWFKRIPTKSLDEFCQEAGLKKNEKFLLYLCSSRSIAPKEVSFVREWVNSIRNCAIENICNMPIIVRPHPQNTEQWENIYFDQHNTVVFPRKGRQNIDESAKQEYYHSLYYSDAIIGINTSGMIEASILNKPIFTILDDIFKRSQEETYHFRYLKDIGPVYSTPNLSDHIQQLSSVLKNTTEAKLKDQCFIAKFIRPLGIENESTKIFADAIGSVLINK